MWHAIVFAAVTLVAGPAVRLNGHRSSSRRHAAEARPEAAAYRSNCTVSWEQDHLAVGLKAMVSAIRQADIAETRY